MRVSPGDNDKAGSGDSLSASQQLEDLFFFFFYIFIKRLDALKATSGLHFKGALRRKWPITSMASASSQCPSKTAMAFFSGS
jgi:hypothetical protein